MALTINTNIINDTDQYLLDAKNVKGTYTVVADIAARDSLPSATIMTGSLCFCQNPGKFYKYNGSEWKEHNIPHTTISENNPSDDVGNEGDIWIVVK